MKLYKYFNNIEDAITAIEKCSFKFTPLIECNDIYEMMPSYKKLKLSQIKSILNDKGIFYKAIYNFLIKYNYINSNEEFTERLKDDAFVDQISELINTEKYHDLLYKAFVNERSKIGICCLSESPKSLLMWAHYSNSHKGICVGYNFDENLWHDKLFKIEYKSDRKIIDIFERNNYSKKDEILEYIDRKSPDWSYEKEVRIVADIENSVPENNNDKKIHIQKYVHSMISEVIIGFNYEEKKLKKLSEILSKVELVHIILKVANLKSQKYEIENIDVIEKYKGNIYKSFRRDNLEEYYISRNLEI